MAFARRRSGFLGLVACARDLLPVCPGSRVRPGCQSVWGCPDFGHWSDGSPPAAGMSIDLWPLWRGSLGERQLLPGAGYLVAPRCPWYCYTTHVQLARHSARSPRHVRRSPGPVAACPPLCPAHAVTAAPTCRWGEYDPTGRGCLFEACTIPTFGPGRSLDSRGPFSVHTHRWPEQRCATLNDIAHKDALACFFAVSGCLPRPTSCCPVPRRSAYCDATRATVSLAAPAEFAKNPSAYKLRWGGDQGRSHQSPPPYQWISWMRRMRGVPVG